MKAKGTIRKDSITHRVYEAIAIHPTGRFTSGDIWESLHKDYPEIKKNTVSGLMCNKKSQIRALFHDSGTHGGKRLFTRKLSMPVLPIHEPGNIPKKVQPIPETVTDHQIGQSIILYIDQLREKIKVLATAVGDLQAKSKSEKRVLEMTIKSKEDTIEKLKDELRILRTKKNSTSRTFNMSEIATFKNGQ